MGHQNFAMVLSGVKDHIPPMNAPIVTHPQQAEAASGYLFALSAYAIWGLLPIFIKATGHIPALEIVAHRILWSVPIAGIVLLLLRRTADLKVALRSPRMLAMGAVTALFITANWTIYVWAIAQGRALDTALGYYINPLMNVLMGALLLGEKFTVQQMVAIGLATLAVLVLTIDAGGLPWISLALAFSFAVYGYLRKTLPIGPSQGFFLEVLLLSVPSLAYILWLQWRGEGHFLASQPVDMALLLACGPATAVPLLLYGFGAKLLRLSTLGLMQYVSPTLVLLIAIFVFGESFDAIHAIVFGLIWVALFIYSWSTFSNRSAASKP